MEQGRQDRVISCKLKDEMNLAEFPLSVIGRRPPKGVKTLVFRDEIRDPVTGEQVPRELTVTGSDLYGLPTSVDEEVLVGCLKLTKDDGERVRKVRFTPYAFLEELGWPRDGKAYRRLSESLDRWCSLTVISNGAYWHKGKQQRVRDVVGVLDRWQARRRSDGSGSESAWFVWGDFIWENLEAGNIRTLDFGFWKSLKSPVSKRLFRLLDKRFYARTEVPFELSRLAYEKVGVSRKMHTGQIKETLSKAHAELEDRGFCRTDYVRRGRGDWQVVYTDLRGTKRQRDESVRDPLCETLLLRGVPNAEELVRRHSRKKVEAAIANYDDRLAHGEDLGPGWLGSCISRKKPYGFRKGYESPDSKQAARERSKQAESRRVIAAKGLLEQADTTSRKERSRFEKYYASLDQSSQLSYREKALRESAAFRWVLDRPSTNYEHYAVAAMMAKWRKEGRK